MSEIIVSPDLWHLIYLTDIKLIQPCFWPIRLRDLRYNNKSNVSRGKIPSGTQTCYYFFFQLYHRWKFDKDTDIE